jgi:hypothetical protein
VFMCSSDSPLSEVGLYLLRPLSSEVFSCSSDSPLSEGGLYLLYTL